MPFICVVPYTSPQLVDSSTIGYGNIVLHKKPPRRHLAVHVHDCGCAVEFGRAGTLGRYFHLCTGKVGETWEIAKATGECIGEMSVVLTERKKRYPEPASKYPTGVGAEKKPSKKKYEQW